MDIEIVVLDADDSGTSLDAEPNSFYPAGGYARIREVLAKYNIALPLAAEEMLADAMCRMTTEDVALDAARYRWLRNQADYIPWFWFDLDGKERDEWIDAQSKCIR